MASEPDEKTNESESEIMNLEVNIFYEKRYKKCMFEKNYNEITSDKSALNYLADNEFH